MAKNIYLLLYNTLNSLLWLRILSLSLSSISPPTTLYPTVEPWSRWTQTLSIAEIFHAATGITRAPVSTTFTQIFTRCVQVWVINRGYPELFTAAPGIGLGVALGPVSVSVPAFYAAMLFAWSLADVVRYAYFVVMLAGLAMPRWLKWLRYSLFFILYPIGIGGEWCLMYSAARVASTPVSVVYYFCLALYAPGAIMMYSYMVKQRRKTLYTR